MPAKTRLAQLVAVEEGFGVAGDIPTRRNNPGDLRHSPHSEHPGGPAHANDIGTIDTVADGWDDLEEQLVRYANRGMDLEHMVYEYAPPGDNNNSAIYLKRVCDGLGLHPSVSVMDALRITAL